MSHNNNSNRLSSAATTTILQRPAVTSHIFKFVTNTVKRAVELAHVCCDFRDAVVNYSPGMWANIIAHNQRGITHCIRNGAVLTFPVIAVVKQGTDSDLVEVLKLTRSFSNRRLIHELLRAFADRVNRLPLPQLLAAVNTTDLCAWLLNEPQPIAKALDAKCISAALLRQPQQQQPHMLLEFSRRVAALPAPLVGLASPGWSFFIAVFLFAASINEATTWLRQFPHRFSVTHPEAREWFGQFVRARIEKQQQSDDFWFNGLAPALLRIGHETRNNEGKHEQQQRQQQVITAAGNAASLLFAVRITNFAVDLSGCVLEDCNLVTSDFTNVVFKSNEHGEAQLRDCVVEGWIGGDKVGNETKKLLERGKRREHLANLTGHTDWVYSVAFSPDGTSIVSSSSDCTVKVWDATAGNCIRTLSGHTGGVLIVVLSPDGKNIVSSSIDRTVKVWHAATGSCIRTLSGHTSTVNSVALSPDGTRIVSSSDDRTVKVWHAATGNCIRTLTGHSSYVASVAFSPDGKSIVSGSNDKTVKVWDAATGNCIRTLTGHTSTVYSVTFSADGRSIVSSSFDKTVKVWDASTGSCIRTLTGHTSEVTCVSLSPDGKCFVSGSNDKTVKVWHAETGSCIRTLTGHAAAVTSVAFSPDGRSIVSGNDDKTVKVWDAATGNCIRSATFF